MVFVCLRLSGLRVCWFGCVWSSGSRVFGLRGCWATRSFVFCCFRIQWSQGFQVLECCGLTALKS